MSKYPFIAHLQAISEPAHADTVLAVEKYIKMRDESGFCLIDHLQSKPQYNNPLALENVLALFDIDPIGSYLDQEKEKEKERVVLEAALPAATAPASTGTGIPSTGAVLLPATSSSSSTSSSTSTSTSTTVKKRKNRFE